MEEVLEEAEKNNLQPKEIACLVLARCCVTGGRFNNFQAGILSVVAFLRDQLGSLGQGEAQALRDLAAILNSGGSEQAISTWLKSHYP